MILHGKDKFIEWRFGKESELKEAIQEARPELFGPSRIYLEIKKKIGKKGVQVNIIA